MKKSLKTIFGVTLLEILLVLVIASFVLVMSIRYYQTATTSSKVNNAVELLTGVMAAVDSYVNAGNTIASVSCSGTTTSSCSSIGPYLPNGVAPTTPWGTGPVTITGSGSNYTVAFPSTPGDACTKFVALATQNTKVTAGSCPALGATGTLTLTVVP